MQKHVELNTASDANISEQYCYPPGGSPISWCIRPVGYLSDSPLIYLYPCWHGLWQCLLQVKSNPTHTHTHTPVFKGQRQRREPLIIWDCVYMRLLAFLFSFESFAPSSERGLYAEWMLAWSGNSVANLSYTALPTSGDIHGTILGWIGISFG